MEFNKTWQQARSQRPLPSLCFSGRSEKQDGHPGLWLAEKFSTSPLKPLNGIQQNLTGSKISTYSTKFVFFGPIGKTRWPPWPLIYWDIFDFSSETAVWNSTKLDWKQDLNVLNQVCVFRADRKKTKWPHWPLIGWDIFDFSSETALASDWLRNFRLLLWNRWTEFKETWQEARSQCPLQSLYFSGQSEKQNGRPGLWLAETFFDFSSETAERNSTKVKWKHDLNILYLVCVFQTDRKNKMAAPVSHWLRLLEFFSETTERNSTKVDRKQDLNILYQVCVFGQSVNKNGHPGWSVKKVAHCSQVHVMWPFGPLVSNRKQVLSILGPIRQ